MAELVPCLVALRDGFNHVFPDRDKGSDGWIGDARHQAEPTSDHNPDSRGLVHAIDVDRDLRDDTEMQEVVDLIVRRQAAGLDRRLKYVIFNRRIWEASHDWKARTYTGKNPHDKHAHFSAVYTPTLEKNISSWHLEDLMAGLTADETRKLIREELDRFGKLDPLATILGRTGEQRSRMAVAMTDLATLRQRPGADLSDAVKAIADAIPDDLAVQVVDELAARITTAPTTGQ